MCCRKILWKTAFCHTLFYYMLNSVRKVICLIADQSVDREIINLKYSSVNDFLNVVSRRNQNEPEFMQAVEEVMTSLWPFIAQNSFYAEQGLLERLVEPERIIQFRVAWVDDSNEVQVNRAWRVQFNSAIGPYKGGMRFHPSVNVSILKFLGFEQTQCGLCGHPAGCLPYATAMAEGASADGCVPGGQPVANQLAEILGRPPETE
jgi:hypothetical protein